VVTCEHLPDHICTTCAAFQCLSSNTSSPLSPRLPFASSYCHPNVPSKTPLYHLLVWHVWGSAWCLVLLCKEGDKIDNSVLLSFVSLCLARLRPPPPTVSICSSLSRAGWGGGETCIRRHTNTYRGCKHVLHWHSHTNCTHTYNGAKVKILQSALTLLLWNILGINIAQTITLSVQVFKKKRKKFAMYRKIDFCKKDSSCKQVSLLILTGSPRYSFSHECIILMMSFFLFVCLSR